MSEASTAAAPPRSFWIIAGLALVWDAIGLATYIMEVTMSEDAIAALDPAVRELRESMPTWLVGAYALAVNTGVLGSLLLLLRKAWAVPVLILSLACIVVQMGYSNFMTDAIEVIGGGQIGLSVMITAVAVFLVWYSMRAKARGWIS